ncbi:glycoside hydrolase superfamily [Zychaea mexicana]|uniref:glycoside hydrolase superfamily n=1 Tax=Zychaea mexicana TaxID=64656 RepID=UPI0022FE58DB|nr:glycoside hydrolase superfamily [Zychaea mexicana]KAI9496501.1 glycoside hydrolase superfamily [Zychaea mexicana]
MKFTSLAAASSLLLAATTAQAKTWLLPIPQSVEWTGHAAPLSKRFTIRAGGDNKHVRSAARRYADLIFKERWVPVQVPYEEETLASSDNPLTSLDISVKDNSVKLDYGVDESYSLDVPASGGKATLTAETWVGALRGLETFSQLVIAGDDDKLVAHTVSITDAPSYPHRGVSFDTSRNYFPVDDLLRLLDAMSYNKMNAFHWHATDAQSWPLVSKSHPELSKNGAYSASEIYGPRDVQRVLDHAESLGIRVVLEIDMPAHTGVIAETYPDYIIGYEEFWAKYAAQPPAGQIDLINEDAWNLVKDLVKEGTEAFPDSFYHTGGDEISTACYELSEDIVNYTKEHNMTTFELWFEWTNKLVDYVAKDLGKRPVVWEDPIRDGGSLPENVVVQVWTAPPQNYTSIGHDVIVSNSDYFYLDCGNGGWVGNDPRYISPTQQATPDDTFNYGGTGGSWCAPYHTWQRMYSFDMTYGIPDDSPGKIIGGEVAMWNEQGGPTVLDSKLWPRSSAAAEVWWSGSYNQDGNRRSVRDLQPRIMDWNYRLVARGIDAQPLQPLWCVKHPERCDLNDPAESD